MKILQPRTETLM
uniref:Uncharacterized protein n=1 Tax=Rhizophora mucronata TaxID=61149 RepID=A0A2P2MBY1_RHIMU